MKTKLLPILLLYSSCAFAQPVNRLANYLYNQVYFNPGASGMYEHQLNVSLLNRFQWVGVKGAPMESLVWVDYKTRDKGLSCAAIFDRVAFGASKRTSVYINPAYSLLLGYKLKLSMGIRAGFEQLNFNPSGLQNVFDQGDDLLGNASVRQTFTKIGAGFQLKYSSLHIGLASVDLFRRDKNNYYNTDTSSFFSMPRNYVLNFDFRIRLNDSYALRPSGIVYAYKGMPMVAGGGFVFEIKDYFWAGGNIYSNKVAALSVGTHLSSRIRFVYSYEMALNSRLPANLGSHEVNLLYRMDRIFKKENR